MKRIIILLISIFLSYTSLAQNEDIDTLRRRLNILKTTEEKFDVIRRMCIFYHQNGISDSLNALTKQLLEIAQKEKNDSLLSLSYSWIGLYFDDVGDFPKALEFYFKSLRLAEKINDVERIGLIHNNISWTYIELGNYANGVLYSKKASAILFGIRDRLSYKIGLPLAYDNVAQAYIGLRQADSALHYTQLANAANLKLQNHYVQAYILCEFGRTYELIKDMDMAESYYKRTIVYGDSLHVLQPLSLAAMHYSNLLLNQKRFEGAKYYGLIGLKAAEEGGYKRQLIDNAEVLRIIYETLNQKDSAYYYAKMVIAYRDTVFNEQKNIQIQNLGFTQQIHEKEAEQEKEKENKERQQNLQYAAIALGVVTFLILFLLFSHSIIANQKLIRFLGIIALLIVFEFINLYIHPYLAHATNDSPLLMLLVMVCIAALLVPVHHYLEKWVIHRLVEKNKKIRLTAAKKTIEKLEKNNP